MAGETTCPQGQIGGQVGNLPHYWNPRRGGSGTHPTWFSSLMTEALLDRWSQRHHRHRRGRRRDPLIVIVRERALEVRLKLRRTAAHIPGPVGELRLQQIRGA